MSPRVDSLPEERFRVVLVGKCKYGNCRKDRCESVKNAQRQFMRVKGRYRTKQSTLFASPAADTRHGEDMKKENETSGS